MFTVPKTTAMKASVCSRLESAEPRMSIPPMRTIPWIAFVPDMSGVCSSVGTREISSMPRKTESTRIVIEAISSRSRRSLTGSGSRPAKPGSACRLPEGHRHAA